MTHYHFPPAPEKVESDEDALRMLERERAVRKMQADAGPVGPPTRENCRDLFDDDERGEREFQEYVAAFDPAESRRAHLRNVALVAAYDRAIAALRGPGGAHDPGICRA